MKLPKIFTNELVTTVEAGGLDKWQFNYSDSEDEYRIEHPSSGSYFAVSLELGRWGLSYLVAGEVLEKKYDVYIWPTVIERLNGWATRVKEDIETPDLWAELQGEARLLGAGFVEDIENTPFTPNEQEAIAERLQELSDYVKRTYALSEANAHALDAKIGYLTEAARRAGRIDWRVLLVGSVFEFLFNAALGSGVARDILFTFVKGTAEFFGNVIQALPSG